MEFSLHSMEIDQRWAGAGESLTGKGYKGTFQGNGTFFILSVVVVTQGNTLVKTHQTIHEMHFVICKIYLTKIDFFKKCPQS